MTRLAIMSILVISYLMSINVSHADGNDLVARCSSVKYLDSSNLSRNVLNGAYYCSGFLQGLVGLNAMIQIDKSQVPYFCPPETGLKNEQSAKIIVKYLEEHPEELHLPEAFLGIKALSNAFPCNYKN